MGSSANVAMNNSSSVLNDSAIRKYKCSGLLNMVIGTSMFTYQHVAKTSMIAMIAAVILVACGIWMVLQADKLTVQSIRAAIDRLSPAHDRESRRD